MSNTIDIIAIITPAPGKADRVEQLLSETAAWVKANEPGTLKYHLQREASGDSPAFVMLET
jgi:quinol monooxygenase YgiN